MNRRRNAIVKSSIPELENDFRSFDGPVKWNEATLLAAMAKVAQINLQLQLAMATPFAQKSVRAQELSVSISALLWGALDHAEAGSVWQFQRKAVIAENQLIMLKEIIDPNHNPAPWFSGGGTDVTPSLTKFWYEDVQRRQHDLKEVKGKAAWFND